MQLTGRFHPHPRGFGFVEPAQPVSITDEDGATHEVTSAFVPPDVARGWLADDLVTATLEHEGGTKFAARSLSLKSRPRRFVVGRVMTFAGDMVIALDPKLGSGHVLCSQDLAAKLRRAEDRQVVAMVGATADGAPLASALVAGPEPQSAPSALRARAVVIAYGGASPDLVDGGPQAVGLPDAETRANALRATGQLAGGRPGLAAGLAADEGPVPGVDLALIDRRDTTVVTIDDDSSRDLDDALSATWSGQPDDPVEIAIHIADAAGTVGIGSQADRYAATMATTAYFVSGGNAPMLDPVLSEDELSLLPGQPRRVVTVRINVAADGQTSAAAIDTSWVQPAARLSYAAVEAYLGTGDVHDLAQGAHGPHGAPVAVLKDVGHTVDAIAEASYRLGVEHDGRDTLDVLFTDAVLEAAVVDGKIRAVDAAPHPAAQRLVERLMVVANEKVAAWAVEHDVPLLFRSHVGFDPARVPALQAAAASIGAELQAGDGQELDAADVLRLVDQLEHEGRAEDAAVIATIAAGSVARASYTARPARHGGLDAGYYTHFTSPIRRYADLVTHRQIRAALAGEELPYDVDTLDRLARWIDARAGAAGYAQALERNALWAVLLQRKVIDWPADAVVSSVAGNGMRIRLLSAGIGGFMTAAKALGVSPKERPSLPLDEHQLATADGRFRVGHRIKVTLDRVDPLGRAEFAPAG